MDKQSQIQHLREMGVLDFLRDKLPGQSEDQLFEEFDQDFSGLMDRLFEAA